ncbi:methyltransferase domain-containing protein [Lacibacterium aquatile]|uniref:Methyltransferase domain-containing protein n=1 Tax=Lacibacterium aquatile TaxID=1168082 RepID=A0ABW5DUQ8_9PROT
MKLFALRCPVCSGADLIETDERVSCRSCGRGFPVVDGIPLLLADLPRYLNEAAPYWLMRDDLSAGQEDMLGGLLPAGSYFDVARQHLSSYARDHYGAFDDQDSDEPLPGGAERILRTALAEIGSVAGPSLDIGCATGGISLALAEMGNGPVIGLDMSAPLIRMAARTAVSGIARYGRRRAGTAYERREVALPYRQRDKLRFVLGDALDMPFADASFGLIAALNVIDCVADPVRLVGEAVRLLARGGWLIAATPFDWSPNVTPAEAWIGDRVVSAPPSDLPELLSARQELVVRSLPDQIWQVRLHNRAAVHYRVALTIAQRKA